MRGVSEAVSRWRVVWPCAAMATLALVAISLIGGPVLPSEGLDPSWVLGVDYAARTGFVFGKDVDFTYGPYAWIATGLFSPTRWVLALGFRLLLIALTLLPAALVRSPSVILAYSLAALLAPLYPDALAIAALFGLFIWSLRRPGYGVMLATALMGPVFLAKLSYLVAALPLIALSDAHAWVGMRRRQLALPMAAVGMFVAFVAAGQPATALPAFLVNGVAGAGAYSAAMQIAGPIGQLYAAAAAIFGLVLGLGVVLWRRSRSEPWPAVAAAGALLAGFAWVLFIGFKAGYVRQDDLHVATTWQVVIWATAAALAYLQDERRPNLRWWAPAIVAALIVIPGGVAAPLHNGGVAVARDAHYSLLSRVATGFGWLTGAKYGPAVVAYHRALAAAHVNLPSVKGTVDAIPYDIGHLITSGLDYRPRPSLQSYAAYTGKIQQRDAAHFANGDDAPDTLFLSVEDIDGRIPTSGVGPSLPIIGQWYDAVDFSSLGLVLHRREAPRPMLRRALGESPIAFDQWVELPAGAEGLVSARFELPVTPLGRAATFLYRAPMLWMSVRTDDGLERDYRFIPGMAGEGIVLSPLPRAGGATSSLGLLDPRFSPLFANKVTAFKISGGVLARASYRTGVARFEELRLAPGYADGLHGMKVAAGLLASAPVADFQNGRLAFDGRELFAHTPSILSMPVGGPATLTGRIGYRKAPEAYQGDGVTFRVRLRGASGDKVVYERRLRPKIDPADIGPVAFEAKLSEAGTLILETEPGPETAYDWSAWYDLELHGPTTGGSRPVGAASDQHPLRNSPKS